MGVIALIYKIPLIMDICLIFIKWKSMGVSFGGVTPISTEKLILYFGEKEEWDLLFQPMTLTRLVYG